MWPPPRPAVAPRRLSSWSGTLAHVIIGRVVPLVVLEGRAWDTGLENLWVHVDSEGAIDWVGVVDPTLRALPDDPFFADRTTVGGSNDARIVALPSEAALTTWIAHRSHRALEPLFDELSDVSGGAMSVASMWHIVGSAVVSAVRRCWMRWSGSGCRSAARLGWGQRRAC